METEAKFPTWVKFVAHLVLATYGVVALSFLLEVLGSVFGHRDRFLDYAVIGPTFAFPIILGLLLGHRLGRRLPPLASRFIWVPSFLLLAYELHLEYKLRFPGENLRTQVWNNYFGAYCGSSECLGEAFGTAPLLSALAYAVGAELGRMKKRIRKMSYGPH